MEAVRATIDGEENRQIFKRVSMAATLGEASGRPRSRSAQSRPVASEGTAFDIEVPPETSDHCPALRDRYCTPATARSTSTSAADRWREQAMS